MGVQLDILVVDDDEADLDLFAKAVRRSGLAVRVQTLTAGRQAIDYLEAKGKYSERSLHPLPDIIVLDLQMPQMNGFDFLAWRKASSLFATIPVVIFSGSQDQNEIKRVFELGADKHILKPDEFEGWAEAVQQIWDFATKATRSPLVRDRSGSAMQAIGEAAI